MHLTIASDLCGQKLPNQTSGCPLFVCHGAKFYYFASEQSMWQAAIFRMTGDSLKVICLLRHCSYMPYFQEAKW